MDPFSHRVEARKVIHNRKGVFKTMSTGGTTDMKRVITVAEKRVILSMGGKGGVGKTGVMVALAEWFHENEIPVKLLDLDTENKARGSLTHFFGGNVPKVNIHTPAGLDAFVDHLSEGPLVILADMWERDRARSPTIGLRKCTRTWRRRTSRSPPWAL